MLELGNAAGFDFELQDMAGLGHEKLMAARNQPLGMASQHPDLAMVRPNGLEDTPQYRVDIDWDKASALGLGVSDVTSVIATAWGSSYVNDFLDKGRVKEGHHAERGAVSHDARGHRPLARARQVRPDGAHVELRLGPPDHGLAAP